MLSRRRRTGRLLALRREASELRLRGLLLWEPGRLRLLHWHLHLLHLVAASEAGRLGHKRARLEILLLGLREARERLLLRLLLLRWWLLAKRGLARAAAVAAVEGIRIHGEKRMLDAGKKRKKKERK